MNTMQENIESLMGDMNYLFVRCFIDFRERDDFQTPPIVCIEVYAMPDDNESFVVALLYEASHRDHLVKMGGMSLSIKKLDYPRAASEFARDRWSSSGRQGIFWTDNSAVAGQIKPPSNQPSGVPQTHWLLLAHLMRMQVLLEVEIAKRSFNLMLSESHRLGDAVALLQPIAFRLSGYTNSLIVRRLDVDA